MNDAELIVGQYGIIIRLSGIQNSYKKLTKIIDSGIPDLEKFNRNWIFHALFASLNGSRLGVCPENPAFKWLYVFKGLQVLRTLK